MTARCKVFGCDYPAGGCSGDCAPAHLTMPEVEWREPLGPVLRPGVGPALRRLAPAVPERAGPAVSRAKWLLLTVAEVAVWLAMLALGLAAIRDALK